MTACFPRAQVTHNAIRFEFVDGTGGDSLERPPNGHPTAAALAACTLLIPAWIGELMRGERPFVQSLYSPSSLGCYSRIRISCISCA